MKGKQYTFEQIKQSFENNGYQLLSTEYKNNKQKLNFICPNGHKHKIRIDSWLSGYRCSKCSYDVLSFEQIKQSFENEGYILLTQHQEYDKNRTQKLNFICPNGHKHKISWNSWKIGSRCYKCCSNKKLEYDFVKQSFINEGYQLLSTKYKNSRSYLDFVCPFGHKHKISWNSWYQGNRCGVCILGGISNQEKEIYDYVKNIYDGTVIPNDRTLVKNPKTNKYLELDIWIPGLKKAIEYSSDYWHNNLYQKWKDEYKQEWCKKNSIDLLTINDNKWRKNKNFDIIKNFITDP